MSSSSKIILMRREQKIYHSNRSTCFLSCDGKRLLMPVVAMADFYPASCLSDPQHFLVSPPVAFCAVTD